MTFLIGDGTTRSTHHLSAANCRLREFRRVIGPQGSTWYHLEPEHQGPHGSLTSSAFTLTDSTRDTSLLSTKLATAVSAASQHALTQFTGPATIHVTLATELADNQLKLPTHEALQGVSQWAPVRADEQSFVIPWKPDHLVKYGLDSVKGAAAPISTNGTFCGAATIALGVVTTILAIDPPPQSPSLTIVSIFFGGLTALVGVWQTVTLFRSEQAMRCAREAALAAQQYGNMTVVAPDTLPSVRVRIFVGPTPQPLMEIESSLRLTDRAPRNVELSRRVFFHATHPAFSPGLFDSFRSTVCDTSDDRFVSFPG